MFGTFVLAASCIFTVPDTSKPANGEALKEYDVAARAVGRSAEANLNLALWCEQHGLMPEREKHLAMAVMADPENAVVRGLLGQVHTDGKWRRPTEIAAGIQDDPQRLAALNQYKIRRDKTPGTADAQWKLGLWCEQNDLKTEATAHFVSVVRTEPNHELARRRLGYRRQGSRWVTNEQLLREKREADAQEKADRHWKPILEKARAQLKHKDKREEAERQLAEVSDPRALNSVLRVFGRGDQMRLARLLGQIDSPESSMPLAMLAVDGQTPEIRRVATETVRNRDPREYVGWLISMVREPLQMTVSENASPNSVGEITIEGPKAKIHRNYRPIAAPYVPFLPGDFLYYDQYGLPAISRYVGSQSRVTSRNQRFDSADAYFQDAKAQKQQIRNIAAKFTPELNLVNQLSGQHQSSDILAGNTIDSAMGQIQTNEAQIRELLARGGFGDAPPVMSTTSIRTQSDFYEQIPVGQMMLSARLANQRLRWEVAADAARIKQENQSIAQFNNQVLPILEVATGQTLGPDRHAWSNWWSDFRGYAQSRAEDKPQFFEETQATAAAVSPTVSFNASSTANTSVSLLHTPGMHSCFGRGTPVCALTGPRAIETLKVGDQVLASDVTTGELSYQPVVAIHHNPPA